MAKSGKLGFGRMMRPLIWWLLLVLVLFAIHTHERLLKQTRLEYSVSFQGQPMDATATLDGKPVSSGENIALGNHTFAITFPKADPYSTNLFIWYGSHNLGDIKLKRSMGTLQVKANPLASSITITGPEFSTNLSYSTGITLRVPTDQYTVQVQYPHCLLTQNSIVSANLTANCAFNPHFGALHIACNRDGATYRLDSADGQAVESGSLPATVAGLPVGGYEVTVSYHNRQLQTSADVDTSTTNDVPFQFMLGAVRLETTPSGAAVSTADGTYRGQTPLLLPDLIPQKAQFNLSLAGYEPVSVSLDITADQTNSFSTNLVNTSYLSAMQDARNDLATSNFEAAVQAATAALNAKPNDADALALQNEANMHLVAERELEGPKRAFNALCEQYQDASLFQEHELKTGKSALEADEAIITELTSAPQTFKIISDHSPEPKIHTIVAQQTFSLGILGGTERDVLIVVGQAKDNETQIWFKVLEFQVQHTVALNGLTSVQDNKRLIPVNPSRMQMNSGFEAQLRDGVQVVTGKIQAAIGLDAAGK